MSPDFFSDSLPASCGARAPFRLCSCSQPQSSPCGLAFEAWASAPSPHLPRWVSRQTSQAGESWSALILCVGSSPLCPLHRCCCILLHGSKASPRSPCLHQWRVFLVYGNFSSFTAPSQRCRSHPYSFVSVFSFFFCPTQVRGDFLVFWERRTVHLRLLQCHIGDVVHFFFQYLKMLLYCLLTCMVSEQKFIVILTLLL